MRLIGLAVLLTVVSLIAPFDPLAGEGTKGWYLLEPRAFAAMTKEGAGAVVVLVDAMFVDQRTRIADLAARHRLPSVYGLMDFGEAGGLIFYGANDTDRFRRAAIFVDKILKGATPDAFDAAPMLRRNHKSLPLTR